MKHTIDAQGQKIGRVASRAAAMLMGKHSAAFAKNAVSADTVEIVNAAKVDATARKKASVVHVTYTGHRGGINRESLGRMIGRAGMKEVFRKAVTRMLPDNKLRAVRMKNLIVKE